MNALPFIIFDDIFLIQKSMECSVDVLLGFVGFGHQFVGRLLHLAFQPGHEFLPRQAKLDRRQELQHYGASIFAK